jgi:hypothetical protein
MLISYVLLNSFIVKLLYLGVHLQNFKHDSLARLFKHIG